MSIPFYVQAAWFAGALLFIFGLKGMSSPTTARRGIVWAGVGMLLAIFGTFFVPLFFYLIMKTKEKFTKKGVAHVS